MVMRVIVAALLISAGLVRGACADGGALKVGVLTDMTSFASDLAGQGSVVAAQMAVEDFGPLDGHPIELISADSQGKPDIGSTIARQWFDQGVEAIADLPPSSVTLAVQSIARERRRILLFSAASAADLIGKQCSPTGFQWAVTNAATAKALASALVKGGGKSWFFITADYAFGYSLEDQSRQVVLDNGGSVLGSARVPTDTTDFASYLMQAKASRAQVVAFANSGSNAVNSLKQAKEFGMDHDQQLAAMSLLLSEVKAIGLRDAQSLLVTESFYWDLNDKTREWSKRFAARYKGRMPTNTQAAVYSALTHYFKAVKAAGTTDAAKVAAAMRAMPVNDFMTDNAPIMDDGWVARDYYLFRIKTPEESRGEWDLYNLVSTIPGKVVAPVDTGCPLGH